MASTTPPKPPKPPRNRPMPRVRLATPADREGYVHAILSGFELDHQFRWRYPRREEFPEDARKATGDVFDRMVGEEGVVCLVAELPRIVEGEGGKDIVGRDENEEDWVIVAAAAWAWRDWSEVEGESAPVGFSPPTSSRRDMDPTRQKIFIDAINSAEKEHFGPSWGSTRLELADLAADPAYHRRGAGKALMEWGMQIARERNVPITLTSSPMGRELYLRVGFRELGYFDCGVEGEEEKVRTWVMSWVPEGWEMNSAAKA